MRLQQGKRYTVTYARPISGPYKGFAKAPITGEYVARNVYGYVFRLDNGDERVVDLANEASDIEEVN